MSWADVCGNCGSHRADCDCGNWSIVRTIDKEENPDKHLLEMRKEMKKQSWIKNVMRIEGFTEEIAEETYNRIFKNE